MELLGGGRRFIAEQLVFVLMLQTFLLKAEGLGKHKYRALLGVALLFVFWNVAMTVRYAADNDGFADAYLIGAGRWFEHLEVIGRATAGALADTLSVARALVGWIPMVIACAGGLLFVWRARAPRAILPVLAAPVALFVMVSVANLCFNQSNVERLKAENFFAKSVVGGGMTLYIYDDWLSVVSKIGRRGRERGNAGLVEDSEFIVREYLREAGGQVLIDPIGFREDCSKGIARPTYFDVDRP
jgi:hypothetical protein